MSNNTPDYENDLYFAVGDQSDGAVVTNTDRTQQTIELVNKIEMLEKKNKELKRVALRFRDMAVFAVDLAKKYKPKDAKGCQETVDMLEELLVD